MTAPVIILKSAGLIIGLLLVAFAFEWALSAIDEHVVKRGRR